MTPRPLPTTSAPRRARASHPIFTLRDRHGPLTERELLRVLRAYRGEGSAARRLPAAEQLLAHYAPLLWSIAERHRRGVDMDDAMAAACVGLFEALDDRTVPCRLGPVASRVNSCVTAAVTRERTLLRTASVSERQIERAWEVSRAMGRLPAIDGLTESEAAAVVSTGMRGVRFQMLRALAAPVLEAERFAMTSRATARADALPDTMEQASAGTMLDEDADEDAPTSPGANAFGAADEDLAHALAALPPADARLLILRYGLFERPVHEVAEIARMEGAATAAVRKRLSRAVQRLRLVLTGEELAPESGGEDGEGREAAAAAPEIAASDEVVACDVRGRYGLSPAVRRYRAELAAAVARQSVRLAAAFRALATERAWAEEALVAAVERFASERTGVHADLLMDAILSRLAGGGPFAEPNEEVVAGMPLPPAVLAATPDDPTHQVALPFLRSVTRPPAVRLPARATEAARAAIAVALAEDPGRAHPVAPPPTAPTVVPLEIPFPPPRQGARRPAGRTGRRAAERVLATC